MSLPSRKGNRLGEVETCDDRRRGTPFEQSYSPTLREKRLHQGNPLFRMTDGSGGDEGEMALRESRREFFQSITVNFAL